MNPIGPGGKKPASGGGKFGYGPKSWNGLSCGKYANSSPIIGNPLRPPLPGKNPLPVTIPFVICFILRSLLRLFWNHTWNVEWIIMNNLKMKGSVKYVDIAWITISQWTKYVAKYSKLVKVYEYVGSYTFCSWVRNDMFYFHLSFMQNFSFFISIWNK